MQLSTIQAGLNGQKNSEVGDVLAVNDDNYAWLSDGSVDLVLTDPPFNIARDTNFHTYEKNTINSFRFDKDKGWDTYTPEGFRALLGDWSKEFARVLRPGGSFAVFCADEYLSDLISALRQAGLKPRRTLTWRKPNAVPVNRRHMMMSACEYIVLGVKGSKSTFNADLDLRSYHDLSPQEIVSLADKASTVLELEIRRRLNGLGSRPSPEEIREIVENVISGAASSAADRAVKIYSSNGRSAELCVPNYVAFNSKAGNRTHPTEKPVQLLTYLAELFSKPGDLVLDPFSGSASTGEAATLTGRRAILVERDAEFFEKGIERIRRVVEGHQSMLI